MTSEKRHRLIGLACALGGTTLFGTKAIVFKLALAAGGSVEQMMALRMGFSLPVYLVIGFWSLLRRPVRPDIRAMIIAAGLGIMTYHAGTWFDFQGLRLISAQLERLILFTYPTIVAVLAWTFLGDRMTWRHAAALSLSYLGVFMLFGREISHQGGEVILGGLLVMGAAFAMAINVTAAKPIISRLGTALFTCVAMGSAALSILSHTIVQASVATLPPFTPIIFIYGLVLAILCTVFPSFLTAEGISRLGPGPSAAVGNAGPVITAILAVMVLSEPFGWPHAAALILTMVGVSLLGTAKQKTAIAGQPAQNT